MGGFSHKSWTVAILFVSYGWGTDHVAKTISLSRLLHNVTSLGFVYRVGHRVSSLVGEHESAAKDRNKQWLALEWAFSPSELNLE